MTKNLSSEAIELLQYLMKNKDTSDFCDYFNASTICHRKGHLKVAEVKPLLEELARARVILPSKELLRSPKYLLNIERANKILAEYEEENTIYTEEYREALNEEVKRYRKFVVTTAVMGKEVNKPFADALRNYAKRNAYVADTYINQTTDVNAMWEIYKKEYSTYL